MNKTIRIGSDFSGVGAFDYAIKRVAKRKGFDLVNVFACDMDKYARQSYVANHGEPNYYPEDVYDRLIPDQPLDVYMTSPPCQAFSTSGKRLGKDDLRGILFFNSLEFIQKNKPRFFIFENVRGLTIDNDGQTFQEWVTLLGGKSINGLPVLFPYEDSVPYHLYHKVLNTRNHGIPQHRERIFLIGIRDDEDNDFSFPPEEHLTYYLHNILEKEVDDKYFLSELMVHNVLNTSSDKWKSNKMEIDLEIARPITSTVHKMHRADTDNYVTQKHRLRRLTPRECFRLQDFPDSFKFVVSDTQLYRQAGNSITVRVLEKILNRLNF